MSTTEGSEKTELTPNDERWPECITGVTTRVEVEKSEKYVSGNAFWGFGSLPAGFSARKIPSGEFEIKVFQDRDAYERNTASAFTVVVDRLSLQGCFIDLPEDLANNSTGQLRMRNVAKFNLRYSEKYGYTAWVALPDQNPQDIQW